LRQISIVSKFPPRVKFQGAANSGSWKLRRSWELDDTFIGKTDKSFLQGRRQVHSIALLKFEKLLKLYYNKRGNKNKNNIYHKFN
jgi:hypothetical protein